jgi:hypothetical protein
VSFELSSGREVGCFVTNFKSKLVTPVTDQDVSDGRFVPGTQQQIHVTRQMFEDKLAVPQRDMLHTLLEPVNLQTGAGLRPLVYTSFDGDYMSMMHWMCFVAHSLGYVPINPETALGSFVINTTFGGSKVEIMRDCLALELLCDEFWHFDKPGFSVNDIPEGVLAELILWREHDAPGPVRIFPWLTQGASAVVVRDLQPDQVSATLAQRHLPDEAIDKLLAEIAPDIKNDIDSRLLGLVRSEGVRPMAYTSQADRDFKHADWARRAAFQAGFVPLNPSTLLNPFVMDLAYGLEAVQLSALARLSVLNAADELWLFLKPGMHLLDNARELPEDVLLDVYFWLSRYPDRAIRQVSWRDVDVPKYSRARWAITDREHSERHS